MKPCGLENESCCLSPVVWGGTYNRSNQAEYPATVSTFRLDRFEVTVGRFRAFVNGFPKNFPKAGDGAHPFIKIKKSGWLPAWNTQLPMDRAQMKAEVACDARATWTDEPGDHENLPINCINWYKAFAFCAWDGGRLPTEAEWNYAAAGGAEQRIFPWSNPPSSQTISQEYAVYNSESASPVGSKSPTGDGKWRQADLAGNAWEWVLDVYDFPYPSVCNDCALLSLPASGALRGLRGGDWANWNFVEENLLTSARAYSGPSLIFDDGSKDGAGLIVAGIRCARQP
jgi:formylglycine-generating enzyme required for sulfatase activity